MKYLFFSVLTSVCCLLAADEFRYLKLNGDFKGQASKGEIAPGWTAETGSASIVPSEEKGVYALHLKAGQERAVVHSPLFTIPGNKLQIQANVSGTGTAMLGYYLLQMDPNTGKMIRTGSSFKMILLSNKSSSNGAEFQIVSPEAHKIQVVLACNPGCDATFRYIRARFEKGLMDGLSGGPKTISSEPQVLSEKKYSLKEIAETPVAKSSVRKGLQLEFSLEEDAAKGIEWNAEGLDPKVGTISIRHAIEGIWPARTDVAQVTLKAVAPGHSTIVFRAGKKQFTVLYNVH